MLRRRVDGRVPANPPGNPPRSAGATRPGMIATAMTDKLTDDQRARLLAAIPMARLGMYDDVAAAAIYLASVEAAYVTGQTLHVNGGMAMM